MSKRTQKFKNNLIYFSSLVLIFILCHLPSGVVSALGRRFGALVFVLAGGERRKTLNSIRTAFPKDFSEEQAARLARSVWIRLGQNLFETVQWLEWPPSRIASRVVRARGKEFVEKALEKEKGVFIVTAHLGNWELLGAYLASSFLTSAVAQNLYDQRFDRIVTRFRENNLKVSMIKRGLALRGILGALKQNHLVLALCDQDSGSEGVFTPFFGKDAWTQSGVAKIALKTGAALIPAFMIRGADGQFELQMDREIEVSRTGDFEKDVLETVRRYTEVIESYVKAYPDQWMWMHQRWRTRPSVEEK